MHSRRCATATNRQVRCALLAASFWYIGSKAETIWNFGKQERLSPKKA